MHCFIPIPFGVDEMIFLEMIQNDGHVVNNAGSSTCGLVVPWWIGAKMGQCCEYMCDNILEYMMWASRPAYIHTEDGSVVPGKMIVWPCPPELENFLPLDRSIHKACIVPCLTLHDHPAYTEWKPSAEAKQRYAKAVDTFGALGASVMKVDQGKHYI